MENYIAVKRCFRFPLNVVFDVMGWMVIILKQGDNCSVRWSPVIEVLWPDILLQIKDKTKSVNGRHSLAILRSKE